MAHLYTKIVFSKQHWHSDDFGLRRPVIQKKKTSAGMCYLYRRTRHTVARACCNCSTVTVIDIYLTL